MCIVCYNKNKIVDKYYWMFLDLSIDYSELNDDHHAGSWEVVCRPCFVRYENPRVARSNGKEDLQALTSQVQCFFTFRPTKDEKNTKNEVVE